MSSTAHKPGAQYYMEAGGFGKKAAEAAGAVLDKILNGEVTWQTLTNADIRKLQLTTSQGAKAVSLALDVPIARALTETNARSIIRSAAMQFELQSATENGISSSKADEDIISLGLAENFGESQQYDFVSLLETVEKIVGSGIIISSSQFGKKVGKHAQDYGLNPSSHADRKAMEHIIYDIVLNYDEIRIGSWRSIQNSVLFFIKGEDVVVIDQNGEFITILKGGIWNERIKDARKR